MKNLIITMVLILATFSFSLLFAESKTISSEKFVELTQAKDAKIHVIDVRTDDEYQSGHLANSLHVSLQDLESPGVVKKTAEKFGAEDTVYLICRSGRRSAKAAELFSAAGHPNFVTVEGGMNAFAENGGKVIK